jgi:hypothetical protein
MKSFRPHQGMTAIEVLASTILSALLMTALIGVLRGLKAHEQTLERRRPEPVWQASLAAALNADLQHAVSYQLTPQALTLTGHGGRIESGASNWLPSMIVYEVRRNDETYALVRREVPVAGGVPLAADNVALIGVVEIRLQPAAVAADAGFEGQPAPEIAPVSVTVDSPLPDDFVLELRSASGEPIFRHRHRRL